MRGAGQGLRSKAAVLGERNFRTFYTGYVTSLLGTSMSTVAIAFAVLDTGASPTDLGYVFAAAVVPQVLLMAFAGAVADRFGRRRVMLCADLLCCGAQASLAVLLFTGRPELWVFVLLAWLGGMGDAFFGPAMTALTVEIAPSDRLSDANALFGLASSVTRIGGPALGGLLIAAAGSAGPAVVVAADAATFAVSALALSLLHLPARSGEPPRQSMLRDMASGWADFRSRTWLWTISVQFAFMNLLTWAPWMLLGPVEGHGYLGGPAVWGLILGVQGAGAILGGTLSLGRRPSRPLMVATIGTFGYALPDIALALHGNAPWVAAAALLSGVGSAVFSTFQATVVQQQVPADMLARASGISTFPAYGTGVIGYGIDGRLASAIGAQTVFGIGAGYGLLSSAVVLALPAVRAVRWRSVAPAVPESAHGLMEVNPTGDAPATVGP
jgi:MFS family permease